MIGSVERRLHNSAIAVTAASSAREAAGAAGNVRSGRRVGIAGGDRCDVVSAGTADWRDDVGAWVLVAGLDDVGRGRADVVVAGLVVVVVALGLSLLVAGVGPFSPMVLEPPSPLDPRPVLTWVPM